MMSTSDTLEVVKLFETFLCLKKPGIISKASPPILFGLHLSTTTRSFEVASVVPPNIKAKILLVIHRYT